MFMLKFSKDIFPPWPKFHMKTIFHKTRRKGVQLLDVQKLGPNNCTKDVCKKLSLPPIKPLVFSSHHTWNGGAEPR
jgi:hypothetical protein